MLRILLQTTIPYAIDDWHVGRFSLLRDHLAGLRARADGAPLCEVTARDRDPGAADDPVLTHLDRFDQVWLFAVDVGDLRPRECEALSQFHARGGGIVTARDHQDLGASLLGVACVGPIEHFHGVHPEEDEMRREVDDRNQAISWPNYHSGLNGDLQQIVATRPVHPLLYRDGASPAGGVIGRFPAHPHENG